MKELLPRAGAEVFRLQYRSGDEEADDSMKYNVHNYVSGQLRDRILSIEVLICLCLVVVTLFVYGQVRQHDFIDFDDDIYVSSNRYVRDGLTIEGLKWSLGFNNEKRTYWHPITWLSHMLDVQIFGFYAGGHLMTNVGLHLLNTLLLFFVFKRWTALVWPAAAAAAIFALHPIAVESVAWVASRKNLLSSFFWIMTILMYGRYAQRPGSARYLTVVLTFILGLMTKPMLVTLPFVLLLMDYWPLGRMELDSKSVSQRIGLPRLIAEKIPLLALAALSIALSMSSLQGHKTLMPYGVVPMGLRIDNAMVSYAGYIGKLFWPVELSVFYPFPKSFPLWQPAAASLLLLGGTLAFWRLHRRKPYLIVGWLWYLGTLVPVIGLVQAGLWPAMADRFAYIPFIGLYIMIAWGCADVFIVQRPSRIFFLLFASIVMILAARTWVQTGYWKNSLTLFTHAIELDENNIIARNNIGKALIEKGLVEEAVRHYRGALRYHPNYVSAHKNLGAALAMLGQTDEAILHLFEALRIDPRLADAHYNLGNIFTEQGRPEEAIRHYGEALHLDQEYFEAHNNLANLLGDLGRHDDAVRHFEAAVRINPRYAKAHNNLGTALFRKNRLKEAIYHYRAAIDIRPDYAEAYNNLGVALKKQGHLDMAVSHYQKALQLEPQYGEAHFNLGLAMASAGHIDRAAVHFEEALRIKPDDVNIQHQREKTRAMLMVVNDEIETVNALIAVNPSVPDLHLKLGDLLKKKGDMQGAVASYRTALVHDGAFVPALNKLGVLYATEGKFERAILAFKEIARLEPDKNEACYWLAGLFAVQKQTDEAIEWLEKAVDRGYSDWDRVKNDPKFRNIRGTSYYKKMTRQSSS